MMLFALKLARRAAGRKPDRRKGGSHLLDRFSTFQTLRPLFDRELRRARRYERPLSLLVIGQPSSDVQLQDAAILVRLGDMLENAVRETDLLGYLPDREEFVALLPEADRASAVQAADRLQELWRKLNMARLNIGVAVYPANGLMMEDLLERGRRVALHMSAIAHPAVRARDGSNG